MRDPCTESPPRRVQLGAERSSSESSPAPPPRRRFVPRDFSFPRPSPRRRGPRRTVPARSRGRTRRRPWAARGVFAFGCVAAARIVLVNASAAAPARVVATISATASSTPSPDERSIAREFERARRRVRLSPPPTVIRRRAPSRRASPRVRSRRRRSPRGSRRRRRRRANRRARRSEDETPRESIELVDDTFEAGARVVHARTITGRRFLRDRRATHGRRR